MAVRLNKCQQRGPGPALTRVGLSRIAVHETNSQLCAAFPTPTPSVALLPCLLVSQPAGQPSSQTDAECGRLAKRWGTPPPLRLARGVSGSTGGLELGHVSTSCVFQGGPAHRLSLLNGSFVGSVWTRCRASGRGGENGIGGGGDRGRSPVID